MISQYAISNSLGLFIELEGEFYPYGIVVDDSGNISPFYFHDGEEFRDSKKLISDLKRELSNYLLNYNVTATALCYLASKKIEGIEYDLLVLEIILRDVPAINEFWFIIEIDKENNIFHVHEKIDLNKL